MPAHIPRVLSIAGSDSGGGAGIQADLKAFARCGVHGMTAISAITAQSTVAVNAVEAVSPRMIVEQVRAVVEDIGVDAVKIGMLGTTATIAAVEQALALLEPATPIVVDPVMVAESGAPLLDDDARDALAERIVARATVTTPNLYEAAALAGVPPPPPSLADTEVETLARAVLALGPDAVVVTGGHRERCADVYLDSEQARTLPGERYPAGAAHGSGCTHSAALAAHLALGFAPLEAARRAQAIAAQAVAGALREIGRGAGPVDALGVAGHAARALEPR